MLRKSNISLSNRALFYPNKKNMLLRYEQLQDSTTCGRLLTTSERIGHSNVTKKNVPKRETANSSFSNLQKFCFGEHAKVHRNKVPLGSLRGSSKVRYPKKRVWSQTFEDAGQSNNCNETTVKAPFFSEVRSSWTCFSYAEAKRGLKAKVLPDQTRPDFLPTSRLAKLTGRSGNPFWFNTQIKSNQQNKFSLRRPFSKRCFATSLVCFANPRTTLVDALVCKANPRPAEGHDWPGANPRNISKQWLEKVGFTFSPFAFIFGTTLLFAALASTLQKQAGKHWLQTLSHTKLPGLTENKISQTSSWVFLESVLSQYIKRNNFFLVSTTCFSQETTNSSKLWKARPRTLDPFLDQPKGEHRQPRLPKKGIQIQLSPLWSQHLKKDFLGVFPLCRTNSANLNYRSLSLCESATAETPKVSEAKVSGRSEKGFTTLDLSRYSERSLNKIAVAELRSAADRAGNRSRAPLQGQSGSLQERRKNFSSSEERASEATVPACSATQSAGSDYPPKDSSATARVAGRLANVTARSVLAPELKTTLTWPWYKITAYCPPNRFVVPTWNYYTTTQANGRLDLILVNPAITKTNLQFVNGAVEYAPEKRRQAESGVLTQINLNTTSRSSEAEKSAYSQPIEGGVEKEPTTLRGKANNGLHRRQERIEGLLTTGIEHPEKKGKINSNTHLFKMLRELELLALHSRAPSWLFGSPSNDQASFGSVTTSVQRLRLEDDSIPSKKASIYSKKKIHQDTLSARVFNVVKKSFYNYGLSIPRFGKLPLQSFALQRTAPAAASGDPFGVKVGAAHPPTSVAAKTQVSEILAKVEVELPLADLAERVDNKSNGAKSRQLLAYRPSHFREAKVSESSTNSSSANFSEGRVCGSVPKITRTKPEVAKRTRAGQTFACSAKLSRRTLRRGSLEELGLIFKTTAIPKKSLWEYAHYISGYNFPELQDDKVADLFRSKRRFGEPEKGVKVGASLQSKVGMIFAKQNDAKLSGHGATRGATLPSEDSQTLGLSNKLSQSESYSQRLQGSKSGKATKLGAGNSWFCIAMNRVFLTPYSIKVPPKVLMALSNKTESICPLKNAPSALSLREAKVRQPVRQKYGRCRASLCTRLPLRGQRSESASKPREHDIGSDFAIKYMSGQSRCSATQSKHLFFRNANSPAEQEVYNPGISNFSEGSVFESTGRTLTPEGYPERSSGYPPQGGSAQIQLPKHTFGQASTAQVDNAAALRSRTKQREQVIVEDFTVRYTPLDLKQENRVKKAFKKLGRDYSDYLKQPKDSLPALLLSPSLEEDKQIEEEEFQRLAQEKAAAKTDAKRTQDEEEYNRSYSTTIEGEFNSLDPLEVAFTEVKNNVSSLEEEPLNDEEIDDSRFERLRFTRELETKKEEEDCRGLALSLTPRALNTSMGNLEKVGQSDLLVKGARTELSSEPLSGVPGTDQSFAHFRRTGRLAKVTARTAPAAGSGYPPEGGVRRPLGQTLRPVPFQPETRTIASLESELAVRSGNFVCGQSNIFGFVLFKPVPPLSIRKGKHEQEFCLTKRLSIAQFAAKKVEPKVSDRKHSFFGQRSFWPTRLFSQEERLLSTHTVNPYIRYDQRNPWLIIEQGCLSLPPKRDNRLQSEALQRPDLRPTGRLAKVTARSVPTDNYPRVRSSRANSVCQTNQTNNFPAFDSASFSAKLNTSTDSCLEPKSARKTRAVNSLERSSSPLATLHTKSSKSEDLQNLKNLQTQARLSFIRFVHFPVVEAGSVTGKAVDQNRIYKSDPRLRLTTLESSASADWRNDRKVEASPFRVSSKDRVHIILPKLSENQWQKSIEWQLKRHFLDEDTRIESLVSTEPFKTFKVKKIERSLPWLTMTGPDHASTRFRLANSSFANSHFCAAKVRKSRGRVIDGSSSEPQPKVGRHVRLLSEAEHANVLPARVRFEASEEPKKGCFKLFQWPYKTVGILGPDGIVLGPEKPKQDLWSTSSTHLSDRGSLLAPLGFNDQRSFTSQFFQNWPFNRNPLLARSAAERSSATACSALLSTSTPFSPFRLVNYSRIPLASNFTTYSKDSSALSTSPNPLLDITNKLFSNQSELSTELLFEVPESSSWFLIYRLFLALILKEIFKYIYRISLKDFFIKILNSDFGRTITSPEFRHSIQFEPFPEFYKPKNRLKDLIGIKNALLPLSEIIWFLRNKCRSRNGPHGVILLGPEGVETTAIAQAVAGEAKVPIIVQSLRALTLTHSHPQKRLEKVILLARAQSPCVLFLDELDVIGQSREGVVRKTSGEENSLISLDSSNLLEGSTQLQPLDEHATSQGRRVDLMLRLLTVMDGLHHLNGVVIITTSKNTATLDPALLRPGRFDRLIHLTLPTHDQRVELFKAKTRGLTFAKRKFGKTDNPNLDERSSLLSVDELEYLSMQTANMNGADIVSAINYSTLRAIVNDTIHTVETLKYGLNCVKALKDKQIAVAELRSAANRAGGRLQ